MKRTATKELPVPVWAVGSRAAVKVRDNQRRELCAGRSAVAVAGGGLGQAVLTGTTYWWTGYENHLQNGVAGDSTQCNCMNFVCVRVFVAYSVDTIHFCSENVSSEPTNCTKRLEGTELVIQQSADISGRKQTSCLCVFVRGTGS